MRFSFLQPQHSTRLALGCLLTTLLHRLTALLPLPPPPPEGFPSPGAAGTPKPPPGGSRSLALSSQLLGDCTLPLPPDLASAVEAAYQLLVELCIRPEEDASWAQEALPAVADARRLLNATEVEVEVPLDHALATYARLHLMHLQAKNGLEALTVGSDGWWLLTNQDWCWLMPCRA